jgi:hypothetical protein
VRQTEVDDVEGERVRAAQLADRLAQADRSSFQAIVAQLTFALKLPFAGISVINDTHRRFVARVGFAEESESRKNVICNYVIRTPGEVLIVPDALKDARFCDMAGVRDSGVRFFCGVALIDTNGYPIGAMCAADYRPDRTGVDMHLFLNLARSAERLFAKA